MKEALLERVRNLPMQAGIYKFLDSENQIIYVGKAKNLRNRVSSYFQKNLDNRKTQRLVEEIVDFEFAVVDSESDAFLLENNLIKQNQPKYNILLKDGKTYPYICITRERFPKVLAIRDLDRTQGDYFGPFASVKAMNALLELIKNLYQIRTCSYNLSKANIEAGKFKVCLEYHLKNCQGACEGLQNEADYMHNIDLIRSLLKGKIQIAKNYFKEKMQLSAQNLAFEEAHSYKQKHDALENYQAKSMVANPSISDLDVFTISSDEKNAYYNFMHIEDGCITQIKTSFVAKKLDEDDSHILSHVILEFIEKPKSRIVCNIEPDIDLKYWNIHIPKIGDLKQLLDLSLKNVLFFRKERLTRQEQIKENSHAKRILETMQEDLRLLVRPKHIECFDNSNIQGTNPVAAMVCFKDGKASKKDYRHFHIKTVVGANDFASMFEIVRRRYRRLLDEAQPLPNLIIIDGGKGQLSAAVDALKDLGIYGQIPLIGIAKRLEEIYYPEDELPLYISKKSETLKLIQQIRNEAHRFAITFHRDTRSKNSLKSQLEEIEGIGEISKEKLLKKYRTIKKMQTVPIEELSELIGKNRAEILLDAIKNL